MQSLSKSMAWDGSQNAAQEDVSVSGDVRRMVGIEAHLGGIDVLVNNAAIAHLRKLGDITNRDVSLITEIKELTPIPRSTGLDNRIPFSRHFRTVVQKPWARDHLNWSLNPAWRYHPEDG